MPEIEFEEEEELDDNEEDYEEVDDLEEEVSAFPTVAEKKMRVQIINQEIKKLLGERDELERGIDMIEDDIPQND